MAGAKEHQTHISYSDFSKRDLNAILSVLCYSPCTYELTLRFLRFAKLSEVVLTGKVLDVSPVGPHTLLSVGGFLFNSSFSNSTDFLFNFNFNFH